MAGELLNKYYSDEELLCFLREGELSAFDILFNRYQSKVYRVALNRLREKEAAEEIVQELFVNLWLKRDKLIITQSFTSYLFSALKYSILNYIRHESVRGKYLATIEKDLFELDNTTEESLSASELESSIEVAIGELPEQCGKVFKLRHKEEFSVKEIAKYLSLSPNTVKNHLAKAQKLLRIQLKEFISLLLLISNII